MSCVLCGREEVLTDQPKVVSETEDAELKALMEQFEQANMDVAGDDDSEEEE